MQNNENFSIDVRIITLVPMRMLSSYGYGNEPENIAWNKLSKWLDIQGIKHEGGDFTTFGFNNPNPSLGSPNYGYEIWYPLSEDNDAGPDEDHQIVDFPGGLYAVTTFKGLDNIGIVWGKLSIWRETSKYRPGSHQWLEELLSPTSIPPEDWVFNLYLPIL